MTEGANTNDRGAIATAIVDANLHMVLATADEVGRPWASPVYYAPDRYTDFYWVSSPEARHSQNLAARPGLGIVIFDSRADIGTGQGVYMSAVAAALPDAAVEHGIIDRSPDQRTRVSLSE